MATLTARVRTVPAEQLRPGLTVLIETREETDR